LSFKRFAKLLLEKALLAGALLATAGLSALTTMRVVLSSQEVVVPSLVEKRVPEAGLLAARQRLLLRVEGKRYDPVVPPDRIVVQEPPAGAHLKAHRSIRVWVSLGPRRLAVPKVEGESLRTARLALEQAQVKVARVIEVEDDAPEGTVLVQRPPQGEIDSVGEGAVLLVSRGRPKGDFVMPDLIGRSSDEALAVLERAGLKSGGIRTRSYPGVGAGTVLRQAPPAGHRVAPGTAVSLEVSAPS
jgi:serine/threonine-protein kinase